MSLMAVIAYAYFWYISPEAAMVFLGAALLISIWYLQQMGLTRAMIAEATEREQAYNVLYQQIIAGNDEIKLGKANRDSVLSSGHANIRSWDELRRNHGIKFGELFSTINLFTILFSAVVIFVFPRLGLIGADDLPSTLPFLLLMIRPMAIFLNTIPDFAAAEDAAITIQSAIDRIPELEFSPSDSGVAPPSFSSIILQNVIYTYGTQSRDAQIAFRVGPVDLIIRPGASIGIFGPNGSGKSTLMRLIPLLLKPQAGSILLDGHEVGAERLESYRDLFAAIYQDPYIPSHLPTGKEFDLSLFREMLSFFEIDHLVDIGPGLSLRYRLSKGQKKRLIMAIALGAQRQILLLDEWTADQDARFRERFRNEIFLKFRELKKTIIFVSHDTQASDMCDTTIYFEHGRITQVSHRTGAYA